MTKTNLETMISLVASKFEIKSNDELIRRIKEEFGVSVSLADILNLHVDLSELEIANKEIMFYDRDYRY
jgi:hypothetical protein